MRRRAIWALGVLTAVLLLVGCQSTAVNSAKMYLDQGQPQLAKQQLLIAAQSAPDDPQVHFLLGKVYGLERDWAAMAAAFVRSAACGPQFVQDIAQHQRYYWTLEYNAGIVAASAAEPDYATAASHFEAATVIDPAPALAWRNLGFVYHKLNLPDKALAAYQQAAAVAPDDTLALAGLTTMLVQRGRYAEAESLLQRLVELTPADAEAFANLGTVYGQTGDSDRAEAAFRQALTLDPSLSTAYYGLGNLHWQQQDYEQAKVAYQEAVAAEPRNSDARFNLAMVHLRLGDDAAALPLLEQLTAEVPDNGEVWRQLSSIYTRQDRIRLAKAADARAKELGH